MAWRSAADLDDLDAQRATRGLVLDHVARALAEEGLAQWRPRGPDVGLVVGLPDRPQQERLVLLVAVVADGDDRPGLDRLGAPDGFVVDDDGVAQGVLEAPD